MKHHIQIDGFIGGTRETIAELRDHLERACGLQIKRWSVEKAGSRQAAGRKGGQATSDAKAAAARANGRKGGRPRKAD